MRKTKDEIINEAYRKVVDNAKQLLYTATEKDN